MKNYMISDPISNFLWGIATAVLIVCSIIYLYRGYQNENFNERVLMFGFAIYFIGFAITRILFYLSQFQTPGYYHNHIFYGNIDRAYPLNYIYKKIAYISAVSGITVFLLGFELNLRGTKFLYTILNVIFIVLMIALPYDLMLLIGYGIASIDGILIFFLLFKLIKKSTEEFQAILMVMLFGFTFFIMGHGLDSAFIKESNLVPLVLAPILYILGSLIAIAPILINPKYFSKTVIYWIFLNVLFVNIAIIIIYVLIIANYPLIFLLPIWIGFAIFITYTFYSLYRTISNIKRPVKAVKIENWEDFLNIFTRPPKITRKEITLLKEQKICLVCKNKVIKLMYICPDCDALYCHNCSNALSNLENACWVCDTPFDESKPQKVERTKEEFIIEAEEFLKRKHKKDIKNL